MTDKEKEKTEKEFMEWLNKDHKLLDNPSKQDIQNKCERAYFEGKRKGLAEGRKESAKDLQTAIRANNAWLKKDTALEEENEQLKAELDSYKALDSHYDEIEEDSKWISEENARLKAEIAEQEETIDAQDDKINFYVAKMNENILKRQELEKESAWMKADLEKAQKHCKAVDDVNAKLRCCGNCKSVFDANGVCYLEKDGKCVNHDKWEMKE